MPDILLVGKGLSGGVVPDRGHGRDAPARTRRSPRTPTCTPRPSPGHRWPAPRREPRSTSIRDEHDRRARGRTRGELLLRELREVCARRRPAGLVEVRGRGLLLGIEFADPGAVGELALQLIEHGVLSCHSLNSSRVLRFTPPAVLDDAEIEHVPACVHLALTAL